MRARSFRPVGYLLLIGLLAASAWGAWRLPAVQMAVLSHETLPGLEQRVRADPDNWRVQYWFGRRALEAGDLVRAEPALRAACGTAPDFLPAATDLGKLLLAQGRVEEAFQVLRMVVGRDPRQSEARLTLAKLYRTQEAYGRALDELQVLLKEDPHSAPALYELAVCQLGIQKPAEAEASLRQALTREPDNVPALTALSAVLRERSDLQEAESLSRKALRLAPDDVLVRLELARVLRRKSGGSGREEALKLLEQAENLAPGHPGVLLELGRLLADAGRPADAVKALTVALRSSPRTTEAYYLLAESYRKLGRGAEASRAEAEFKRLQDYGSQLKTLYSQLEANPDSAALRFQLGDLHASEGDLENAIRSYRLGLQRAPHNEKARQRLAALVQKNLELQAGNAAAP